MRHIEALAGHDTLNAGFLMAFGMAHFKGRRSISRRGGNFILKTGLFGIILNGSIEIMTHTCSAMFGV
jgi:hypothetical protein